MSRVALGILTASVAGLLSIGPAAAGCCGWGGGWGAGWGWGGGCCASFAAQPAVPLYWQPTPQVVTVAPVAIAPVAVVPVAGPVVVAPVPARVDVVYGQPLTYSSYMVNQGPVFSGPGADFSPAFYYPPQPAGLYPYAPGFYEGYYQRGYPAYRTYKRLSRPVYRSYRTVKYRSWR
jgi:hypothetical protein